MLQFFTSLESTSFATWLRESNTIWAYPMVLTLHTGGLALLVGASMALDLRLLGFAPGIPVATLSKSFRVMWFGFWLNLITGLMLFVADASTKGATRLFAFKLGLVAAGVASVFLIERVVFGGDPERTSTTWRARTLAGVSLVIWVAAITAGRFMAYV